MWIKREAQKNPRSLANTLPSAQFRKCWDRCCGIHGAARERKGLKHAKVTARRRLDKEIIEQSLEDEEIIEQSLEDEDEVQD